MCDQTSMLAQQKLFFWAGFGGSQDQAGDGSPGVLNPISGRSRRWLGHFFVWFTGILVLKCESKHYI